MQIDKVMLGAASMSSFVTGVIAPAATAAGLSAEQAFTVAAPWPLLASDVVAVSPATPSGGAAAVVGARVNATGQLVLNILNPTAGALTVAASAYSVLVARP